MVWYVITANITTNTKNCDLPPTLATQPNQANSKDAKIKLEPTVATCGCVDGSTPMYGMVEVCGGWLAAEASRSGFG